MKRRPLKPAGEILATAMVVIVGGAVFVALDLVRLAMRARALSLLCDDPVVRR